MNFNLPICFFDTETTGTDPEIDKIVEIAIIKVFPDGKREIYETRINPMIPIPLESSNVHGIYDKDVEDKPTFEVVAENIFNFLKGSILSGFNSDNFDNPILHNELERCGYTLIDSNTISLDIIKLYRHLYPNTLGAIFKRFFGKELDGAHDAKVDIEATIDIFEKMISDNSTFFSENDIKQIVTKTNYGKILLDIEGKVYCTEEDPTPRFNFGAKVGMSVRNEPKYVQWMLDSNFSKQTKAILRAIMAN